MNVTIFTTGGTIDKVYFDALSEFHVGESEAPEFLSVAGVGGWQLESLMKKDSLDIDDADRALIRGRVEHCASERILITHGTDTMVETGRSLAGIAGKTIVLTGAMRPSRLRVSDAAFNLAFALAASKLLPAGVYLAMHGAIFDPFQVRKNRQAHRFEAIAPPAASAEKMVGADGIEPPTSSL
jgi:L-asparaginase